MIIAEEFESTFVRDCLEYNIYRPTVYEAADSILKEYLNDQDIRDLIILYSMNPTINRLTPKELYVYYKTNLRGRCQESILAPITQNHILQLITQPLLKLVKPLIPLINQHVFVESPISHSVS